MIQAGNNSFPAGDSEVVFKWVYLQVPKQYTISTPVKSVSVTGVTCVDTGLNLGCSAKPQDEELTDLDSYNVYFMNLYSVLDSTRLWAGTCPDEAAEHPQAYSCCESLPMYVLNNVEISWEAYAPWLYQNNWFWSAFVFLKGHNIETQPDIACLIPSVIFDLNMY